MADPTRTLLRNIFAQRLQGLASTGARVFPSRTWPLAKVLDEGPALLVYCRGGSAQFDSQAAIDSRALQRDERLVVEGHVRLIGVDPDDALDRIGAEVETKLMEDEELIDGAGNERLQFLGLIQTDIDARAEGGVREGRIRLTFRIVYRTAAGDPTRFV